MGMLGGETKDKQESLASERTLRLHLYTVNPVFMMSFGNK